MGISTSIPQKERNRANLEGKRARRPWGRVDEKGGRGRRKGRT
jgi:hypothetical protein